MPLQFNPVVSLDAELDPELTKVEGLLNQSLIRLIQGHEQKVLRTLVQAYQEKYSSILPAEKVLRNVTCYIHPDKSRSFVKIGESEPFLLMSEAVPQHTPQGMSISCSFKKL
jgi:hypothetical protein